MRRAGSEGFTLLEAIVALTIVALAGVAALAAVGADLRAADRARRLLTASELAEWRLAALELEPPETLASLPDAHARGRFGTPFGEYSWEASAELVRGEADLYEIAVEVSSAEISTALRSRVYRPTLLSGVPDRVE